MILRVLQPFHPQLPLDSRTLLKTPIRFVTKPLENGDYCHFGLIKALNEFLEFCPKFSESELKIAFNVDGLPLFHSSSVQLWPILGLIKNKM